jgi:hypothetical protein
LYTVWAIVRNTIEGSKTMGEGEELGKTGSRKQELQGGRVQGSGFRVQGSGFRVQGSGFRNGS